VLTSPAPRPSALAGLKKKAAAAPAPPASAPPPSGSVFGGEGPAAE
jgi:hypothetical protein